MKKEIPTIVITEISDRWNYFQYFLFSLYTLKKNERIKLKFKTDFAFNLSRHLPRRGSCFFLLNIAKKIVKQNHGYNLLGYISLGKVRKYFCIDSADSPYLFSYKNLISVDCYFKMQCPKEIKKEGFNLTDSVCIPYQSHELDSAGKRTIIADIESYTSKIKPLMVGFRQLATMNTYRALKDGYTICKNGQSKNKSKKAMCYFGNALGPKPNTNVLYLDVDQEADLMGFYTELQHPNEKRRFIADFLSTLGPNYDARIISDGNADSDAEKKENLIIPIESFCKHVADFQYNINVSGYRKSIPNRFVESFIVGTAIFTDKLSVKWYKPFNKEVVETEEMGYKRNDSIDWRKVKKDLVNLPDVRKEDVINAFNSKWAPEPLGNYILETLQSSFK